jgi:uncharacterized spore protein YtfJ
MMSESTKPLMWENVPNQQRLKELVGRLFEVARITAVFGEPVSSGDYTVITASELMVGMGAGFGGGGGEEGSGGGGGSTMTRPVAVIAIGPNGVTVEPIVDPTKIAITLFTALGAMGVALVRMRRMAK